MIRHFEHLFQFSSDVMGRGSYPRTIQAVVEFDLDCGPMYDTPFGPMGQGCRIECEVITGLYLENGQSLLDQYKTNEDFRSEVDHALKSEQSKMMDYSQRMYA